MSTLLPKSGANFSTFLPPLFMALPVPELLPSWGKVFLKRDGPAEQ